MQRPTLLDAPDVNVRINRLIVIHRENVLFMFSITYFVFIKMFRSASWSCSVCLSFDC